MLAWNHIHTLHLLQGLTFQGQLLCRHPLTPTRQLRNGFAGCCPRGAASTAEPAMGPGNPSGTRRREPESQSTVWGKAHSWRGTFLHNLDTNVNTERGLSGPLAPPTSPFPFFLPTPYSNHGFPVLPAVNSLGRTTSKKCFITFLLLTLEVTRAFIQSYSCSEEDDFITELLFNQFSHHRHLHFKQGSPKVQRFNPRIHFSW